MKKALKKTYKMETKSNEEQIKSREILYKLFRERPLSDEELLICPGLYMRSSALTKILFINEAYELILNKPGIIVEFGTWWGQNIILFENLRAIYEPFNQSRRIVGFDTFVGYPKISNKDKKSDTIKVGGYNVVKNYENYLKQLIEYHEKNNVLGSIKKHEIIKGDVSITAPKYFKKNKSKIIALAYFDMALYQPTKRALQSIIPHLVPGSVIMLDEFNNHDYPGETLAFKEVFKKINYTLKTSKFIKDRTFIIIK